ncbi:MAG: sulfite exporter TauE/SafE family protein [Cyanobacteria bacterium K_Offshore_surface_m2_239]|nr:sulfite exporter TauE/SafE family protein [Cyanobacteria bacterium K_Offshore_surface_m2_239]
MDTSGGFGWFCGALAGVAAGLVNALAGGGSLISYPALTALGLSPLMANLTNTVALTPGYLGAAWSQRRDLAGQGERILWLVPAACLGGLTGAWLLLRGDERLFAALVPWLILFGSALLALQTPLRGWLRAASDHRSGPSRQQRQRQRLGPLLVAIALAAVYGGYFGAGLSVILLAVLGLALDDNLTRLNGLKQLLSFATNACAALLLSASGRVDWAMALIIAVSSIVGGALGGALAHRLQGEVLRWLVVMLGALVGLGLLLR